MSSCTIIRFNQKGYYGSNVWPLASGRSPSAPQVPHCAEILSNEEHLEDADEMSDDESLHSIESVNSSDVDLDDDDEEMMGFEPQLERPEPEIDAPDVVADNENDGRGDGLLVPQNPPQVPSRHEPPNLEQQEDVLVLGPPTDPQDLDSSIRMICSKAFGYLLELAPYALSTFIFIAANLTPLTVPQRVLSCAPFIFAMVWLIYRSNSGIEVTSQTMRMQTFQLMAEVFAYMLIMGANASIDLFSPVSEESLQALIQDPTSSTLNLFVWIIKCTVLSYFILFIVDIPALMLKMAKFNKDFREVLAFELVAHLLPVAHISCPFLLINILAVFVSQLLPPERQSWKFWSPIHLLALGWIAIIIMGIIKYPEIEVPRRHGRIGYFHMMDVVILQMFQGIIFLHFLLSIQELRNFCTLVRKSAAENGTKGGLLQPLIYFQEILNGIPSDKLAYMYPYPITFMFLLVLFFVVRELRFIHLVIFYGHYVEKSEQENE